MYNRLWYRKLVDNYGTSNTKIFTSKQIYTSNYNYDFDFIKGVTDGELDAINDKVNMYIVHNTPYQDGYYYGYTEYKNGISHAVDNNLPEGKFEYPITPYQKGYNYGYDQYDEYQRGNNRCNGK